MRAGAQGRWSECGGCVRWGEGAEHAQTDLQDHDERSDIPELGNTEVRLLSPPSRLSPSSSLTPRARSKQHLPVRFFRAPSSLRSLTLSQNYPRNDFPASTDSHGRQLDFLSRANCFGDERPAGFVSNSLWCRRIKADRVRAESRSS